MNAREAYKKGVHDAHYKRYPLYSVLVAAEEHRLADSYREGWLSVWGEDLYRFKDPNKPLPPRSK